MSMLSIEEALARVLAHIPALPDERVFLGDAGGRVLAEAVDAPGDLPPWPNSAMDGYAVRAADVPGELHVLETIAAGAVPTQPVGPGQSSRIMTGAPVPDGADSVVMVEDTETVGDRVRISVTARLGQHVRPRGADVRQGDRVLAPGVLLTPGRIGLLAALGIPSVRVRARPRVALLSTGDEVVEPGFGLGPGQIHSSNTHALAALVAEAGGIAVDLGNVADDPAKIGAAFAAGARCDLLVSTGGVSVGDFDHVKAVIGAGVEFWRVAMRPGKPLAYGQVDGTPVFGLPGNPVSCMVNFLQFVRPVIRTMLGDPRPFLPVIPVELDGTWKRHAGRPELVRVALRIEDGHFRGMLAGGHQGSGNVRSMAEAHGFALIAGDALEVAGTVNVQVYDWSFAAGAAPAYAFGAGTGEGCC